METREICLTRNQIFVLSEGKKHWSEKADFLLKKIKNFGYDIKPDELGHFIEVIVPSEQRRIKKQFFLDSMSGKRVNNLTPTDVKGTFGVVEDPTIGFNYHISWAFSGAVFQLMKIENGLCYLDNPKHKRKDLLVCKVAELRHLATRRV